MLSEFNTLIELMVNRCLEKKKKLNLTFEQISENSEIPLSTTYSFLKKNAQNPSLITGGAICKVLGVSLDAIFGIEDDEMSSEEISRIREEAKQNEAVLHQTIKEHAQNILLHEVDIENSNEIIRRQDIRMKELSNANNWLSDRVEYQKKAVTWLRFLSVGLFTYALLITAAIIVLLFQIIPMIQSL